MRAIDRHTPRRRISGWPSRAELTDVRGAILRHVLTNPLSEEPENDFAELRAGGPEHVPVGKVV